MTEIVNVFLMLMSVLPGMVFVSVSLGILLNLTNPPDWLAVCYLVLSVLTVILLLFAMMMIIYHPRGFSSAIMHSTYTSVVLAAI